MQLVDARLGRRSRPPVRALAVIDEGAVEAVAEAVGQQVVGLAGVGGLGEVAVVGPAEAEAEHRRGQRRRGRPSRPPPQSQRPALDGPAPPMRQRRLDRLGRSVRHRVDAAAGRTRLATRVATASDRAGDGERGEADAEAEDGDGGERRRRCRPRQRVTSSRRPVMAISAGSSVIDVSIVASTVADTPTPMPESIPRPTSRRPSIEIDDRGAGEHDGPAGGAHRDHDGVPRCDARRAPPPGSG